MSLLKVNALQVGQSLTATDNYVWYQPTVPDGTVRLGKGNSGSSVDVIKIDGSNVSFLANSNSASSFSLYEDTDNGTNYVSLKAPAAITSNVTWVLPSADGSNGQYLKTDGAGNLSFATVGVTASDDTTTNTSYYPALFTATSGSQSSARVSSTKLYFNPSTGILNATGFAGTGTGITSLGTSTSYQIGSLGVGTTASETTGEIRATDNITAFYSSDVKFKENVKPIENALDKVVAIGGKTFDWTDEYISNHGGEDGYFIQKNDFGVIAQDVQKVFPQAVRVRPDGSLAVDYEKLSALAFAAICDLKIQLDNFKTNK